MAGLGAYAWGCLPSSRCAHFINPVRRARQARVVVIFQRHSSPWYEVGGSGGLDCPFPGKMGLAKELAATEPVQPKGGVVVRGARNTYGVIYFIMN